MFTQTPSRTSRKRNADQFAGLQPPAKPIFTPAPQQPPPQLIPQPSPGPENAPTTVVADPFSSRQQGTTRLVEPVSFISALYPELQQQRVQRPRVHESVLTRYAEPEVPALEGSVLDDDRTTMDLEPPSWRNANTLVEGDKHVVEVLGKIPSEVQEAFRDSDGRVDFYQHAYGARVDPTIGYALVWTKSHAFVWFYQRHAVPTLPTCFIFPLPQITVPGKPIPPLPLVVIVPPLDRNREPGLIACSVDGEIRYWEAVSLALSSPDRFSSVRLYLNEGENITVFNVVEEGIYILGTSHTRLLRVTLDPRLQSSALAKPVGVLARVGNLLGYRDPDATNEELEVARRVVAIVPGVRVEMREVKVAREVYALTPRTIQKWIVSKNTVEKFVSEQDILTPIRENILSNVQPEAKMPQKAFKVTLVDLEYSRDNQLVVLTSYVGNLAQVRALDEAEVLWYSIVVLEMRSGGPMGNEYVVVERIDLKHSSYPDLRPRSDPTLALPNGGPGVFVVFPDTIVLKTLFKGTTFEDEIILRNRQSDRIIGLGLGGDRAYWLRWGAEMDPTSIVIVVASESGILKCEMNIEAVEKTPTQPGDAQIRQTLQLKSKLEQAVFFDSQQQPLSFDLTKEFDGNLNKAALDLSNEILESTSKHIPTVGDLKISLRERLNRLKAIVKFIDANRVMNKLSLDSCYQLCWDAERMAAATDLWHYQNSVMGRAETAPHTKLLAGAIKNLLQHTGDAPREDFVRWFFRYRVSRIGNLFRYIHHPLKDAMVTWQHAGERGLLVNEANKILLIILKAALQYRNDLQKAYQLTGLTRVECWTAVAELIDILQAQYEFTERTLRELSRDSDDVTMASTYTVTQDMDLDEPRDSAESSLVLVNSLKDQLCDIADVLLKAFVERKGFLELTSTTAQQQRELRALEERYHDVRPKVIKPLVPIGRTESAFQLAEQFGDFKSLVELSSGLAQAPSRARIQYYIGKFREEFAYVLFAWYIEKGMLHALLNQDDVYNEMLHEFLEQGDGHPRISWIHDLRIGHCQHASQKLIDESEKEQNREEKKTMLSISKLAFLATVEYDELNNEDIHTIQEEIDDKLDVLTINSQLMQVFQNELKDGGPSLLDGKVKVVVDSLAAALKAHEKFAFEELFSQLVKVLLVGNSILGEDLIDALTLKNNHKCAVDYLYAIEVYRRAKDLPEARREAALKTAWRRTFLHDDWESLSISKGLTDEQRRELLMKTAVFKVLSTAYQQNIEKEYLLKPSECYFTSPRDDLRARFQGMPDHQLDTLVNDYQIENKQLDLNINQFGLADLYEEIRDLEERQRTGGYPLEV